MDTKVSKSLKHYTRRSTVMRKIGIGLILLIITLTIAGCGVPQDEYFTVVSNLAQTEQELEATKAQLTQVSEELADAQSELDAAKTQLAQVPEESASDQSEPSDVSGTIWTGFESDGDYYEYFFMSDGSLHYKSPTGFWTKATWKQDGNKIYMEFNNRYAENEGTIQGDRMEGDGWNITGLRWTWSLDRS